MGRGAKPTESVCVSNSRVAKKSTGAIKEKALIIIKGAMRANEIAHLQPGLVLTILHPRPSTLTGCRVERGLGFLDQSIILSIINFWFSSEGNAT